MRRIALALALGLFLLLATTVGANDRRYLRCPANSGDNCPPPPLLAQQMALVQSGVWDWQYQQDAGAPNIKSEIVASHDDYAADFGIDFEETGDGNIEWARTSSIFYYGDGVTPGCPGAVGCLPQYGQNVTIWYDAQVMATYFFQSGAGVVRHENCHAIADCGEEYVHTGGQILCNGDPSTVMSCGIGHSLFLTPFDIQTISHYLFPPIANGGALVGSTLFYGPSNGRTSRKSIWFRTYAGYLFFAGQYASPCFADSIVCGAYTVQGVGKCTEVLFLDENAIPGSWNTSKLQSAGWTSCF